MRLLLGLGRNGGNLSNPPGMIPIASQESRKSERNHHELAYLLHSSLFTYHSCKWLQLRLGPRRPLQTLHKHFRAQMKSKSIRVASFFGVSF